MKTPAQWNEYLTTRFGVSNFIADDVLDDWKAERTLLLQALKPFAAFADSTKGKKPDEMVITHISGWNTPEVIQRVLYHKDFFAARDLLDKLEKGNTE